MILRLAANAATHAAAGATLGLLGMLAACTIAQAAMRTGGCMARSAGGDGPLPGAGGQAGPAPVPPAPPPGPGTGPAAEPAGGGDAA